MIPGWPYSVVTHRPGRRLRPGPPPLPAGRPARDPGRPGAGQPGLLPPGAGTAPRVARPPTPAWRARQVRRPGNLARSRRRAARHARPARHADRHRVEPRAPAARPRVPRLVGPPGRHPAARHRRHPHQPGLRRGLLRLPDVAVGLGPGRRRGPRPRPVAVLPAPVRPGAQPRRDPPRFPGPLVVIPDRVHVSPRSEQRAEERHLHLLR